MIRVNVFDSSAVFETIVNILVDSHPVKMPMNTTPLDLTRAYMGELQLIVPPPIVAQCMELFVVPCKVCQHWRCLTRIN